jgi:hypothetical protein
LKTKIWKPMKCSTPIDFCKVIESSQIFLITSKMRRAMMKQNRCRVKELSRRMPSTMSSWMTWAPEAKWRIDLMRIYRQERSTIVHQRSIKTLWYRGFMIIQKSRWNIRTSNHVRSNLIIRCSCCSLRRKIRFSFYWVEFTTTTLLIIPISHRNQTFLRFHQIVKRNRRLKVTSSKWKMMIRHIS